MDDMHNVLETNRAHHQLRVDEMRDNRSLSGKMHNANLAALRMQNPFLVIMPMPNNVISMILAANTPQDITLASGTKLVTFKGNNEFYVSRNGQAVVPAAFPTDGKDDGSGTFNPHENVFYYVEEIRQFSIVAANANTRVTIECFAQL